MFKITKISCLAFGLLLVLFSCSNDDAKGPISNSLSGVIDNITTLGGSNNESAQSVAATSDGGYVVLGHAQSMDGDVLGKSNNSFDYWLIKYNEQGVLEWSKTYGGLNDERGSSVVQTQDGGYAILGYTTSSDGDVTENAGGKDFWVLKVDPMGNLLWQKSHGFMGADYGIKIKTTSDNGLILIGVLDVTASAGDGNDRLVQHAGGDYWAIKLDGQGNKLWRRYYGGNLADTPNDVIATPDGGFILIGKADSQDVDITNNKGTYDFWVVKINSVGAIVWQKNYGGSEIDSGYGITATSDGNYLLIGDSRSTDQDVTGNNGAADVWIVKINPDGELLWQKTFGGSSFDVGRTVCQAQEGGFLIAGSSRSLDGDMDNNQGQNDALVIKIDDNGSLEWQKTIGGSNIDFLYGITQLSNGNVIAVGDSTSSDGDITENKGFSDALIITLK